MTTILNKLNEFETLMCFKCKTTEMEINYKYLWCCSNCGFKIRDEVTFANKKIISKNKLKKYILSEDMTTSYKIIRVYLKRQGYSNIANDDILISNLYEDLKINSTINLNKLFNLKNLFL
jgi:hypothetical protein